MTEQAVYNTETSKWYRQGCCPGFNEVEATSYPEAFELLFGHPAPIPAVVRSPRRSSIFGGDR